MAQQLFSSRFTVENITKEDYKYQQCATVLLKSLQHTLKFDYPCQYVELEVDDVAEVVIYRDHVKDSDVPREFNYVCLGKMYSISDDQMVGSFNGLQMVLTGENIGLDDRCDFSMALRVLKS
ncbi:hypothetical protein EDEG_03228 [Edhazardia aedis USNM 41457]|uniref:DNA-directed RNA polymerases I, II, and III subunit RPABC3 n=1 Tax=Edhazardia aedis (strain USNM 41457) TaxID=1003232 RepID=J9D3A7_EDHAE|nr:hypothetical protein EDEG_03228 [Edhazardia aedis USNM 41457]|eukprot:EJW02326.1 hypothetical protein EDEG_03228 [Edhazardia aedis USNM 41457]